MRITGSISGADDNVSNTKYFDIGDSIRVKYLGEKYDISDKKFNTWFYNNLFVCKMFNNMMAALPLQLQQSIF